jgi:SAM-dependent methyltransferase
LNSADYVGDTYRVHLGQNHDLGDHRRGHDELARFTVDTIWPISLREKVIADIGCGGGSLLDHFSGLAKKAVAIDPAAGFADSLRARGYDYFSTSEAAAVRYGNAVDFAFAIQVIEHVDDPVAFLAEVLRLLKPGAMCVVSTPNRDDILMDLLPNDFPAFFYRTQHRWAFDASSLATCASGAGFNVREVRHVHRYGMANALLWLRERKPAGREDLSVIDRKADTLWRAWLESTGRADNLYIVLIRP